jgi:P27 family predicted phage terminase small subunit
MTQRAKRFYAKAVKIMQEAGAVQVVDGDVLSMYCVYLDKWLSNAAKLKKEGDIVVDWRGQPVKNPRFDVVLKTGQQVNAFASKLGFSPADRERIKARGKAEESALEKFARMNS